MRPDKLAILMMILFLNFSVGWSWGQEPSFAGDPVYEAVFDRLFPSVGQGKVPINSHNIVLKFGGTSIETEMEILIYGQGSKEERYEVWYVPIGNPPISQPLEELQARLKTEDPEVLASSIHVEHTIIDRPTEKLVGTSKQIAKLSFPPSQDEGMVVDGAYYSFYMRSISNHTRIELMGSTGPFSGHPLIKWMAAVRSAVEAELNISKSESRPNSSAPK